MAQADLQQLASKADADRKALEGDLARERAKAEGLAGDLAAVVEERGELQGQNQAMSAQVSNPPPLFMTLLAIRMLTDLNLRRGLSIKDLPCPMQYTDLSDQGLHKNNKRFWLKDGCKRYIIALIFCARELRLCEGCG